VAATKLHPPRPRAGVVERRRLDERLDRLTARQVTFVSAAAGYGKTIAVTSWLRRRGLTAAWVSLDESDDDPAALWTSIAAAIVRAHPDMPPGRARPSREDVLSRITAYGRPVLLVLDDFDAVTDARAIASLGRAGRDLPANLKVIAVTRGHLPIEAPDRLGAPELAFTAGEARELLAGDQGLALSDAEVGALVERTEGWPAGLYLAALWLRGPDAAIPPFTAGDRNVTDYVTGEVLDALDADTRAFLLETSVLGRFSAALADHARGRSDSAALLERVSRANLFLVALDDAGEWFRYHALFGELLRRELALDDAAAAPRLHARAAEWLLARGELADGIEHADAAGDHETVAGQLQVRGNELIRDGRGATLLRWVSRLPEDLLLARPDVTTLGALASDAFVGRDARGQRLLELAERSRDEHPERWSPGAATVVAMLRANEIDGDVAALVAACRRAVALADDGADDFTVAARAMLANALLLAGDVAGGREIAEAALASARTRCSRWPQPARATSQPREDMPTAHWARRARRGSLPHSQARVRTSPPRWSIPPAARSSSPSGASSERCVRREAACGARGCSPSSPTSGRGADAPPRPGRPWRRRVTSSPTRRTPAGSRRACMRWSGSWASSCRRRRAPQSAAARSRCRARSG
jgi:LuxR family maltose regulon positive regulatory protein